MKAKAKAPASSSKVAPRAPVLPPAPASAPVAPPPEPLLYTQRQLDAAVADSKILDLREQAYQQALAREAFFCGHFYTQLCAARLPANELFDDNKRAGGISQLKMICQSTNKGCRELAPRAQIVLDMLGFFDAAEKHIACKEWGKAVDQALLFGGWLERLAKRNDTAGARASRGQPYLQSFERAEQLRVADPDPRKPASLDCAAVVRYCPEMGQQNTRTLQNQLSKWREWQRNLAVWKRVPV